MSDDKEDMIERVARAIWDINRPEGAPEYEDLDLADQLKVELIAMACIETMREPTEAMVADCNEHTDPVDTWKRMIDAALKEND